MSGFVIEKYYPGLKYDSIYFYYFQCEQLRREHHFLNASLNMFLNKQVKMLNTLCMSTRVVS